MSSDNAALHLHAETARTLKLLNCTGCGKLQRAPKISGEPHCCRCGHHLANRSNASLSNTWALLITALLLYIPANTLPIMYTTSIIGNESNTIISGVIHLWHIGAYDLATVVFVASVLVPIGKIASLATLSWLSGRGSDRNLRGRTKLYRILERIGPWSMLDIFVVALLATIVQFQSLATIQAGPGALAFGAVVLTTMFASISYDPRLAWDNAAAAKVDNKTNDQDNNRAASQSQETAHTAAIENSSPMNGNHA